MMHSSKLLSSMLGALSIAALSSFSVAAQMAPMSPENSNSQTTPTQQPSNSQTAPTQRPANSQNQNTPNNSTNQGGSLNASDRQFMIKAAQSDMNEIMTSRLALQRASSAEVKSYAQVMIQQHTDSSSKLKPLAQQKGVTLPNSPSPEGRALMTQLSKLSGRQFDQAYMRGQAQAHARTEAEYRRQLQQGQDPDVRAFANQVLPVVAEHRRMAEGMVAGRSNGNSTVR